MNCKHVQELLPLYIGGDLEEKDARILSAHLQSCSECNYSADEYRKTMQLVQRFEPPAFSEATYSALRRNVLREIERESNKPRLFDFIAGHFQPRVLWAVSTVVLLAFCLSLYYFVANRTSGNIPQIVANPGGEQSSRDQQAGVNPRSDQLATTGNPDPVENVSTPPVPRRNIRNSRLNLGAAKVGHSMKPSVAQEFPVISPPYSPPVQADSASFNAAAASEKTLRMEIQTKDPNVRIIWFSHQRTKQDSPAESSKGI